MGSFFRHPSSSRWLDDDALSNLCAQKRRHASTFTCSEPDESSPEIGLLAASCSSSLSPQLGISNGCNSMAAGQQHQVVLCLLLLLYGAAFLSKVASVALGLRGSLHVRPP